MTRLPRPIRRPALLSRILVVDGIFREAQPFGSSGRSDRPERRAAAGDRIDLVAQSGSTDGHHRSAGVPGIENVPLADMAYARARRASRGLGSGRPTGVGVWVPGALDRVISSASRSSRDVRSFGACGAAFVPRPLIADAPAGPAAPHCERRGRIVFSTARSSLSPSSLQREVFDIAFYVSRLPGEPSTVWLRSYAPGATGAGACRRAAVVLPLPDCYYLRQSCADGDP